MELQNKATSLWGKLLQDIHGSNQETFHIEPLVFISSCVFSHGLASRH